ncbi:MAG: type IV pilus assembly protein PilM [Patescibacteria group bacterium]|jgi:type IV pilus assembly protein PilM
MKLNPFKNQIGLDISDFKIRFIQFQLKKKHKYELNSLGEVSVPAGIIKNGEIIDEKAVSDLIKSILIRPTSGRINTKFVNASLPEKKIFIKTISIPKVPENEIDGAVSWGIEQNIPVTIDQVNYDWQIIEKSNNDPSKMDVLVAVAPKTLVDTYTRVIQNSGLILIGLENESIAIARCLLDQQINKNYSTMIIDLGRSRTNITVYANASIQLNATLDINGTEMTKQISKTLKLSENDAEKAKIICGLDKRKAKAQIFTILEPIIIRLANKITEYLSYYNNYFPNSQKIKSIILTGSASSMVGLTDYLKNFLNNDVKIGDPQINLISTKKEIKHDLLSFTTAIGLAIKDFNDI